MLYCSGCPPGQAEPIFGQNLEQVDKRWFNPEPRMERYQADDTTAISAFIHAWLAEGVKLGEQAHSVGEPSTSSLIQAFLLFTQLAGVLFFLYDF